MLAHPSSGNRAASPTPQSPGPISPSRHRYAPHASPSHAHTHAAHYLHQHPSPSHHHNHLQHPRPVTPNVHYQSTLSRSPSHDDTSIAYDGLVQIHHRSSLLELEEQKGGQPRDDWQRRLIDLMSDAEGAYALVVLVPGAVYGCRDRYGIRPLCLGEKKGADGSSSWALSSESCGFGPIGFTYVREIAAGEIVRLNAKGVTSLIALPYQASIPRALCIFEYVYFARPDTLLENQLVHTVRQRFGRRLAAESPVSADIVAGVPDSSIAAAIGYSAQSGIPFMEVLCKNRYIGRTFIQPEQAMRENSIRLKFNPLAANLAGKRIVLVDDSLVRGNTLKQLIPLLKLAGAVEVHIRICSPVLRHPCYMGVDIGTYDEILATHMPDIGSMAAYIGADSLQFLSHAGMIAAVKEGLLGREDGALDEDGEAHSGHCSACFTGEYPVTLDIEDEARSMNRGHC
jgi:amidophosphoribosyltransferase